MLILASPDGVIMEYTLQFDFKILNNEIEYEVLIVGLHLAKELRVKDIKVFTNLQLVVG